MAKIRDIEITAVDEVPVTDSIVENYEADVPEEVVQSVAEAIVLEAEEQDKTVEEVVSEIVDHFLGPEAGCPALYFVESTAAVDELAEICVRRGVYVGREG